MKVAVNIHCLHPPLTGIGHYARHLLQEMLRDDRVDAIAGVSHSGWHSQEEVEDIVATASGYTASSAGAEQPALWRRIPRAIARRIPGVGHMRARINHGLQRRQMARHADHLYWEPNYLLLPIGNPAVATVHDLSYLRYPEFLHPERLQELQRMPETLSRSRHIVAVSEFTRRELIEACGLHESHVSVVPPAVSQRFRPQAPEQTSMIRERYGLPREFILYAGTIEPRKNLPALLDAYSGLPEDLRARCPLVLAGGRGWQTEAFDAALARCGDSHVVELGYVDHDDLPLLFSAATVFAYPSLYEGFGMPVLEAMASGTPVLTSDLASMPEVAAGAATLVDPRSPAEIGSGLRRLLNSATLRQQQVENGLEVARRYSWDKSWSQLHAALAKVAA